MATMRDNKEKFAPGGGRACGGAPKERVFGASSIKQRTPFMSSADVRGCAFERPCDELQVRCPKHARRDVSDLARGRGRSAFAVAQEWREIRSVASTNG